MKLTVKLKPGRKTEWVVRQGRTVVAEINRQLTGGVKMQYRPYLRLDKPAEGSNYSWKILGAEDTLEAAVEVVEVVIAGAAAKFANAMSRKIAEEGLQ